MAYRDPDRDRQISDLRAERDRLATELQQAATARAAGLRYAHQLQHDPATAAVGYALEEILGGGFGGEE